MARPDITAYITANGARFYAEMRRVRGESSKTGKAFERDVAAMSAKLRGAATAATAITGALLAATAAAARTVRTVADIGREAERAGLGVEAFQELGFVAEQNRIPIDALTDGLKEMNLRADEFAVTGKGSAAEAFARLGLDAEELAERLSDPNALFVEIIARMEQLDRAAQIRIADEIFGGTGGERFVELMDTGAAKIRQQIELANDLGIVMDEDLIERAEELDRQFSLITQRVGTSLQSAIVAAASQLAGFLDLFREFENRSNRSLHARQSQIMAEKRALLGRIAHSEQQLSTFPNAATRRGRRLQSDLEDLRANVARLTAEEDRIIRILSSRSEFSMDDVKLIPIDPDAAKADKEAQAVRDLIAELEFERSLIGMSKVEREQAVRLRQAGSSATRDQRAQIVALVEAIERETAAVRANEEAQRARGQAIEWGFGRIGDAIGDLADSSKDASDAIRRLAIDLALAVAQAALLRSGPLAGLFSGPALGGSIFGGSPAVSAAITAGTGGPFAKGAAFSRGRVTGFAKGTIVREPTAFPMAGGTGVMGEAGEEAIMPLTRLSDGRLGVEAVPAPAPMETMTGLSRLRVELSPDLTARILEAARGQSVDIARAQTDAVRRDVPDIVRGAIGRRQLR